jgi:AMMECR1 domain-containing protein
MRGVVFNCIEHGLGFKLNVYPIATLPSNVFGVFVSISRNNISHNIHGCIGYWNDSYKVLSQSEIIAHLGSVSVSSSQHDSRKDQFPPICTDTHATYKIYFMLLPVYPIHNGIITYNHKKIPFANNDFGIIVNQSGRRATYLPYVFPGQTLAQIKHHLLDKAGVSDVDHTTYTGYLTKTYSYSLWDYFVLTAINTIRDIYTNFVPYELVHHIATINKSKELRNIATMCSLLDIILREDVLRDKIRNNINEYNLDRNGMTMSTKAFLALALHLLKQRDMSLELELQCYIEKISVFDDIDVDFELCEVIYVLLRLDRKPNNMQNIYHLLQEYDKTHHNNVVFRRNWMMHCHLPVELFNDIAQWAQQLKHIDHMETNELAVLFELSCYAGIDITVVLKQLSNRRLINGLFAFTNGRCRLDVTSRILHGFTILRSKQMVTQ